jgi:large subunit ribosomal protein L5
MLPFKELYKEKVVPAIKEKFNYRNPMQIPKLTKICLNMGVGDGVFDSKNITSAVMDLTMIAAQKPVVTMAKKSIASFKLRKGVAIGCKVVLRKDKMFQFLERLVLVALPRIRDFRGFSVKNFDGNGNFTFGVKEQIIFPEIDYDKIDKTRGLDITFVTTAKTDEEAKELLAGFNIPFLKI